MAQTGQYSASDVASTPQTGQYSAADLASPPSATPQGSAVERTFEGIGEGLKNLVTSIPQQAMQFGKSTNQFVQEHPILSAIPGLLPVAALYDSMYAKPTAAAVQHVDQQAAAHGTQNSPAVTAGHALAHVPIVGPMALKLGEEAVGDPQAGVQPNLAGALGEAGTYAVAPELARAGVGAVADQLPGAAREMYQSALKPSTRTAPTKVEQMISTGLDNAIPVSKAGVDKLAGLIDDVNDKIQATIDASPNTPINKFAVTSRLGDTAKQFANQVNPDADLEAIGNSGNEFLKNQPGAIPASEAQQLKTGTYQQLKDKAYGQLSTAAIEAQKALARGLKEELANQFPELSDLNKQDSDFYGLQGALEKAVQRIGNHQLIGIGTPLAGAGAKAITGSNAAAATAGVMKAVLDNPMVKSRLAISLSKAGVTLQQANSRIASLSTALDQAAAASNTSPPGNQQNGNSQ